MSTRKQLALKALSRISEIWQIDDERLETVDESNTDVIGFNWWPGDYCVRVRAYLKPENKDYPGFKLQMMTDFISDIRLNERFEQMSADLSRYSTSTYAWVYEPAFLQSQKRTANKSTNMFLSSSIYIYEEIADWATDLFAHSSIIQPINAQIQAGAMAEIFGTGKPNQSKISPNAAFGLDNILEVVSDVFAPQGKKPSFFAGSPEFEEFTEKYARQDICFGMGDVNGMTLETPFGNDSALIRFLTSEKHPQLGHGLLMTIQLPWFDEKLEIARQTAELNYYETVRWTDFPQLGCWHSAEGRDSEHGVAFSLFLPNAVFKPGLITNLAFWAVARAQLVKRIKFPEIKSASMNEIMKRRFSHKDT